jgi:hypothetical protein
MWLIFALCLLVMPTIGWAAFDENGIFVEDWDYEDWSGTTSPYPAWSTNTATTKTGQPGDVTLRSQVTSDAKHPLSTGRAGFREWILDGNNQQTGVFRLFIDGKREIWFRYYVRYEEGFNWDFFGYDKFVRVTTHNVGTGPYPNIMLHLGTNGAVGYVAEGALNTSNKWNSNYNWASLFTDNGTTSHGRWVCLELYLKMESELGADDGIVRVWVEGELAVETTNATFINPDFSGDPEVHIQGWQNIAIACNQNEPGNLNGPLERSYAYKDYDSIVIRTTTPPNEDLYENPMIGPLGWGEPEDIIPPDAVEIFHEGFEDDNWLSRGWDDGYDSTGSTAGGVEGNALNLTWVLGNQRPTGFTILRNYLATGLTEFYFEYYAKYEDGWEGSHLPYHPHLFHFLSDEDGAFQGLSRTHSSLYFAGVSDADPPYAIRPTFHHQDMWRVNSDPGNAPAAGTGIDLSGITEDRSANQCNTPAPTGATGTCYHDGLWWYSVNTWKSPTVTIPTGEWVRVVYYVKQNTFTNGVGNFDGVLRTWIGDELALEAENVLYTAGAFEGSTWNQIAIAPWIGAGSPVEQTMWIDELRIYSVENGNGPPPNGDPPTVQGARIVPVGTPGSKPLTFTPLDTPGAGRMRVQ